MKTLLLVRHSYHDIVPIVPSSFEVALIEAVLEPSFRLTWYNLSRC